MIGRYTRALDTAVVTAVTQPPADSRSTPTRFLRGGRGLAVLLAGLWNRPAETREYYLGEWHYHPDADPVVSAQDRRQMTAIAEDERYRCPEPILVIVAGSPGAGWQLSAQVFPRRVQSVPLLPTDRPRYVLPIRPV